MNDDEVSVTPILLGVIFMVAAIAWVALTGCAPVPPSEPRIEPTGEDLTSPDLRPIAPPPTSVEPALPAFRRVPPVSSVRAKEHLR